MFSLPNVAKTSFLLGCLGLGFKKPDKNYQKVGLSLPNVAKTRFLLCFVGLGFKKVKKKSMCCSKEKNEYVVFIVFFRKPYF